MGIRRAMVPSEHEEQGVTTVLVLFLHLISGIISVEKKTHVLLLVISKVSLFL